ncbi:MAG: glycosyltransferase family 4 protein [Flavobacterium sp.]
MKLFFFNVAPLPHSIDLQKELSNRGHEVTFWYLEEKSKYYPWQKLEYGLRLNIFDKKFATFLKAAKQALKNDVIIITGWHSWGHVMLALLCKLTGKKFSYWLDIPAEPQPGFKKSLRKMLLSIANGYFVTGTAGIDFFVKHYQIDRQKSFDFPYLEFKPDEADVASKNEERKARLAAGEKIRVLISNRFLERKGYSILLAALQKLSTDEFDKFQINILGTGPEFEKYKNAFESIPGLKLFGWVEYEDYLRLMAETDIFIHTSLQEPFGIPPIDAMSHGKLLISSDNVYSSLDRIVNGVNGYLYDKNSSDDLAKILGAISKNSSGIYQMGQKALETSRKYGAAYNEKTIIDFYKK